MSIIPGRILVNSSLNVCKDIELGSVDIAINHSPFESPKIITEAHVVQDKALILMRKGHPLAKSRLTDDNVKSQRFCSFNTPQFDQTLKQLESVHDKMGVSIVASSENLNNEQSLLLQLVFHLVLKALLG